MNLTPKQIVEKLDNYVIGQQKAKKAVAIALRNRYRRSLLPPKMQEEVIPKNILMIGPTGVGKTEIARRLAKMAEAPFLKVEATKFTEVGYVGRDVESIIRDLLQIAIHQVKRQKTEVVLKQAEKLANEKILDILSGKKSQAEENPLNMLLGGMVNNQEESETSNDKLLSDREKLLAGELDDQMIEIEVDDSSVPVVEVFSNAGMDEMGLSSLQDAFSGLFPKRKKLRKVTVKEARKIFTQEEAQKLIDFDEVVAEA
ncbi:MAG: AAA family ATPase, partial [bacterium]